MAKRAPGRTSKPDKPVKNETFEQTDDNQHHQKEFHGTNLLYMIHPWFVYLYLQLHLTFHADSITLVNYF